jgi:hypothetical protein
VSVHVSGRTVAGPGRGSAVGVLGVTVAGAARDFSFAVDTVLQCYHKVSSAALLGAEMVGRLAIAKQLLRVSDMLDGVVGV